MVRLIILARHAKADVSDSSQKLTESGRKMQLALIDNLKKIGITPNAIWTSPLLRALQTAAMFGDAFGIDPKEELVLGEQEMFDEMEITNKIKEMPDESTLIIVTHAPQILRLATNWTGTQFFKGTPPTSSALFLEFGNVVAPGKAHFVQLITSASIL